MRKSLITLSLIALLSGCVSSASHNPNLELVSQVSGCASINESTSNYVIQGGEVVLTTELVTPTPCYEVKSLRSETRGSNVTITLSVKESGAGFCTQCIGQLSIVYKTMRPDTPTRFIIMSELRGELRKVSELLIK